MTTRSRKRGYRWMLVIAPLAVVAMAMPASAHRSQGGTRTIDYWEVDNHTTQNASIDADDTGFSAIAGTGPGRSKLGRVEHSWISEVISTPVELEECPDETVLALEFFHTASVRLFKSGDRLHFKHDPEDPGHICFFADGTATATINQVVVGGTGRYDGATGRVTSSLETTNLLPRELETTQGEFWGPGSWTTEGTVVIRK